jgi:PBP1b-binding outer membrane lipoprotein LpoB
MNKSLMMIMAALLLLSGCAMDDPKSKQEQAEIDKYKNQPLQRDGDKLNPRRD